MPLLTPVGVARMRSRSSRMVMLPSLAATQPFLIHQPPDVDNILAQFALASSPFGIPNCIRLLQAQTVQWVDHG